MKKLTAFGFLLFAIAPFLGEAGHAADSQPVIASADGRHVFLVRPGVEGQVWEIAHLDATKRPLAIRSIVSFARRPEAIASSGAQCWVLLPAVDAARPVRDLVSFSVTQHPLNDVWTVSPPGRLRYLPPVETKSALVQLSATEDAPVVVALPSQRRARGISRDGVEDDSTEAAGEILTLRTPDLAAWVEMDPPGGFDRTIAAATGRSSAEGDGVPAIAWRTSEGPARLSLRIDDAWSTGTLEGDVDSLPRLFTVGDRSLLGFDLGEAGIEIGELRSSADDRSDQRRWRRLAKIDRGLPSGDRTVVGTDSGPWVVGLAGSVVEVLAVDPITGVPGQVQVPVEDTGAGTLIHLPVPFLVLFTTILATVLLRPLLDDAPKEVSETLERAGLFRRAAAVCIDCVPGFMLAIIIFDVDPASFLEEVRRGRGPDTYPPAIFAILFTGLFAGVVETIWDRSIGKAVVGIKVVDGDGNPGSRLQRLLRAGLKINVLYLPLIAIVAAVDPHGRGLPELATRSMVCVARGGPRSEVATES